MIGREEGRREGVIEGREGRREGVIGREGGKEGERENAVLFPLISLQLLPSLESVHWVACSSSRGLNGRLSIRVSLPCLYVPEELPGLLPLPRTCEYQLLPCCEDLMPA